MNNLPHSQEIIRLLFWNWQGRCMLAVILTVIFEMIEQFAHTFSADIALLLLLLGVTFLGIGLHFVVLLKTADFRTSAIIEGIFRLPLYCLYLFLVGSIGISVEHSIQVALPILNLFISYMIASEIFSIVSSLRKLGVKVPTLLVFLATDLRNKVENKIGSKMQENQKDKSNE